MFIGLLGNIVLARMLSPNDFGQVGIAMSFVFVATVLAESGLSGALIRMNVVSDEDYSTVFIFNFLISLVLFLIFILFANTVAKYYHDDNLKNILIVLSLILIINSFRIVQNAKLVREMEFKKLAYYKLSAIILATIISIILAYLKYGVWSIVAFQVLNSLFLVIMFWLFEKGFDKLKFSIATFKKVFSFGVNTTVASLLKTFFDNIYNLILGRFFSIIQVGFFFQARKLQNVPESLFKMLILNVIYSYFSKIQNDTELFIKNFRRVSKLFIVIFGISTTVIFYYSNQIILVLYGEKWLESVFYLRILAVSSFFYMQEIFSRNIFKIFDKTSKILLFEIFKEIIQLFTIIISIYYNNLYYLMFGFLLTNICSHGINYYNSRKIINTNYIFESIIMFKVVVISILTIMSFYFIENFFQIESSRTFLLLPIFITFYFLLIGISGIVNVLKETKYFLNIIRN